MAQDYYAVLGVSRTASEKDIQAAYRKLAREKHPDKLGNTPEAEAAFTVINEAYGVLRDPESRKKYDSERGGGAAAGARPGTPRPTTARPGGGASGHGTTARPGPASPFAQSMEDLLGGAFAGVGARVARPGAGRGPAERTSSNSGAPTAASSSGEQRLEITLEEAIGGSQRIYRAQVEDACPDCRGSGKSQSGGLMPTSTICPSCRGSGRKRKSEEVPVNIPAGAYDGLKLRLKGKGPMTGRGERTDLFLTVHIRKHESIDRNGSDLTTDVPVPYTVMALGGDISFPWGGSKKTISVPAGTPSGHLLKVAGQGIPGLNNRPPGDLYARLKVDVPKNLGAQERKLLVDLAKMRGDTVKA